jgi:hypothetical protein
VDVPFRRSVRSWRVRASRWAQLSKVARRPVKWAGQRPRKRANRPVINRRSSHRLALWTLRRGDSYMVDIGRDLSTTLPRCRASPTTPHAGMRACGHAGMRACGDAGDAGDAGMPGMPGMRGLRGLRGMRGCGGCGDAGMRLAWRAASPLVAWDSPVVREELLLHSAGRDRGDSSRGRTFAGA